MDNELIARLEVLSSKIGTQAAAYYNILVEEVVVKNRINAGISFTVAAIALVACVFLGTLGFIFCKKNDDRQAACWISGVLFLVLVVGSFGVGCDYYTNALTPNLTILEVLKGLKK